MEQPKRREDESSRRPARRVRWKLLPETWNPTAGLAIFSERMCTGRRRGAGPSTRCDPSARRASRPRSERAAYEARSRRRGVRPAPRTPSARSGIIAHDAASHTTKALIADFAGCARGMRPRAQRRLPGGSLRSLQDMSREAYATGGVPSKLPKMASIMTRASIGSSETPTTRRAGTQPGKNSA